MDFGEQYLTYLEYKSLGGSLDLMPFNLLEFEARRQIDAITQNRLKNVDEIPQEVKFCAYKLVNTLQAYINETNRNIQSEHVGEYIVTYGGNVNELLQGKNFELNDIILNYLYGVIVNDEHLIYTGVE